MIRVGLCDDEPILLKELNRFVADCYRTNRIFARVEAFEKARTLLWEMEDGGQFDLLLLDIEMPLMGCIVNLSRIMSIRENYCILKDGTCLSVSQSRMPGLKKQPWMFV